MSNYVVSDTNLTLIANTIRSKTGTSNELEWPQGYVNAINNIQGTTEALTVTQNGTYTPPSGVDGYAPVTVNVSGSGGSSAPSSDVNFYDYDGTIVASYTASDFANLTTMPSNPSHTGLTSQGWNWSLSDAKAYVAKYGALNIGQMYITDDGKTRIYIHLEEGRTSPMLGVCPNGTVDVDWGDGTAHDTLTGTSTSTVKWTPNHAYAAPGDYVVKLTVTGKMGFYGSNSANQYSGILRYSSGSDTRNYVYRISVLRIEIGDNVTSISDSAFSACYGLVSITIPNNVTSISDSAFSACYGLVSITIPNNVTSIGSSMFTSCHGLASITIPDNVTSIGNSAFQNCYSLASITIPDSVTSISGSAFSNCYSLTSITIPDGITSISSSAFQNCFGVSKYHLKPITPPTLASFNAFTGIPTDCIIYVPYSEDHSILNAYQTATNWSTYASRMREESA